MVEVLVALVISSLVMTAAITALDTSFKAYKSTTESASTNVVARMVVTRVASLVRTGTDFGPFPADVLDASINPMQATFMEFRTFSDPATDSSTVIRLERRDPDNNGAAPFELWYVETRIANGAVTLSDQRPLLTGLEDLRFTLEYDVGPRLRKATMDMTVRPNDFQDASFAVQSVDTPSIRLVTSMAPRKLDEVN
jgi:type II secretory pathway pseudopilin PulG